MQTANYLVDLENNQEQFNPPSPSGHQSSIKAYDTKRPFEKNEEQKFIWGPIS